VKSPSQDKAMPKNPNWVHFLVSSLSTSYELRIKHMAPAGVLYSIVNLVLNCPIS
jgi:hypothetical protein